MPLILADDTPPGPAPGWGVGVLGVDGQVAVGGVAPVAGSGRSALLVGGLIEKNEGTGVLRLGVSALSGA